MQKLDKVVKFAEEAGVKILFSLTNNWNPLPLLDNSTDSALIRKRRDVPLTRRMLLRRDVTFGTNNTLPRNFLSNDYGELKTCILTCASFQAEVAIDFQEEWMHMFENSGFRRNTVNSTPTKR